MIKTPPASFVDGLRKFHQFSGLSMVEPFKCLASVVQRVNSSNHWVNYYSMENVILVFDCSRLLDYDLSIPSLTVEPSLIIMVLNHAVV